MTSPSTVGALIARHHTDIIKAWTETASQASSARDLTSLELSSLMPEYVSLLGHDFQSNEPRLSAVQQALIERHLSNRLREGFHLYEILTELAVLGRCISWFLDRAAERERPSVAEVASLYAELYLTSAAVTRIFNEHALEDEQTMKRYTRLLEGIASDPDGFDGAAAAPSGPLHRALSLIVEAMAACGAVLLIDHGVAAAAAAVAPGLAELATFARALEATTFAGRGGATGTAAEVLATSALRQRGLGTLLRVRLPASAGQHTVLYVGIAESRSFTASETRRLEGLGRALTVHLDNAHLRGALRRQTDALQGERALRERATAALLREVRDPIAALRAGARGQAGDELDDRLALIEQSVDRMLAATPAVASDREP